MMRYLFIFFHVTLLMLSGIVTVHSDPVVDDNRNQILAGQSLVIGVADPIISVDPQKAFDPASSLIANAVGETLYRTLSDGKIIPLLAEDSPQVISSDIYRITLRKGIRFHNGETLGPQDVIFTIDYLKDPKKNPPTAMLYKKFRYISPLDDTHIECAFNGPVDELTNCLARSEATILSQQQLSALGNAGIMSTGAFFLKDWQKTEKVVLNKNEPFWQNESSISFDLTDRTKPIPYLGQVVINQEPDMSSLVKKMRYGSIQIAIGLTPDVMPALSERSKYFSILLFPSHKLIQLYINKTAEPFDQVEIRKAISWSTDRNLIIQKVMPGCGESVTSPLLPEMKDSIPANVKNIYSYSKNSALNVLQQAGFDQNTNMLSVNLIVTDEPLLLAVARQLQEQWINVGIALTIHPLKKQQLLDTIYNRNNSFPIQWHIALEDWYDWRKLNDPISFLKLQYHSTSQYNKIDFSDVQVDQLLGETSSSLRQSNLDVILSHIADECSVIPLVSPKLIIAYNKRLQNLMWDNNGTLFLERCWLKD